MAGEGYKLKMAASRTVFGEILKKYPSLPFSLRSLEAKNARLGIVECVNHDLLQPYPVMHEKASNLVAQFKATVLLMPNGSDRVTNAQLQQFQSEKQVPSRFSSLNPPCSAAESGRTACIQSPIPPQSAKLLVRCLSVIVRKAVKNSEVLPRVGRGVNVSTCRPLVFGGGSLSLS